MRKRRTKTGAAVLAISLGVIGLTRAGVTPATSPTELEQYLLEVINRARMDPNAEVTRLATQTWGDQSPASAYPAPQTPNLNEGLPAGTISAAAKQPLAFDLDLITAARNHSQHMLQHDTWGHSEGSSNVGDCWSGNSPGDRAQNAGYPEDVAENIAVRVNSAAFSDATAATLNRHNDLFIDGDVGGRGHRTNILNAGWTEVGLGLAFGTNYRGPFDSTWAHAQLLTENFGSYRSTLITGVAYNDVDSNGFYTPDNGEALGGLIVQALDPNGGIVAQTDSFASGGYSLDVPPGTYTVRFTDSAGDVSDVPSVTLSTENVKVDAVSPTFSPSPIDLTDLNGNGIPDAATAATYSYAFWTGLHFLANEAALAVSSADPDHDGQPNLLEYAMGTDPRSASGAPIEVEIYTDPADGAQYLAIVFNRVKASSGGARITIQRSSEAAQWDALGASETVLADDGEIETIRVLDSVAIGASRPLSLLRVRADRL